MGGICISSIYIAAENGDLGNTYKINELLRLPHDVPHSAVLDENGEVCVEAPEVEQRWTRHWLELLRAHTNTLGNLTNDIVLRARQLGSRTLRLMKSLELYVRQTPTKQQALMRSPLRPGRLEGTPQRHLPRMS